MRISIKATLALLLVMTAVSTRPAAAQAASTPEKPRPELALGYSYVRSNLPPGGCTCFNLNGGNATFAWPVKQGTFAVVGDVTIVHAGSIGSGGQSLTLSTFTTGARYLPPLGHSAFQPFGQVLVGLVHSSGSLVQGNNPGAANAGAAFASIVGGGIDLRASRRFSIRLIEAGYLLTTVDNGSNDHQNNLRLGAGVVIRFGR